MNPTQSLAHIRRMFNGGRALTQAEVDQHACCISSKGTDEQVVNAFAALPALSQYGCARMMLLRRLFLLGPRFIDDPYYYGRFSKLQLMSAERLAMIEEFGRAAYLDFIKPPVLKMPPAPVQASAGASAH